MQAVGLVVNIEKAGGMDTALKMVEWLEARAVRVYLTQKQLNQEEFGALDWFAATEARPQLDCIIVLGGDGTLLQTARAVAKAQIPILGVNFGQLGFLTEIEVGGIFSALEKLLAGEYTIEERMMLDAMVKRDGEIVEHAIALNDVVIAKGACARLISLHVYVDDELTGTLPADGVIVATPTGSTAYSMSAGGPLIPPTMEVILITPICPHSLTSRPFVLCKNSKVRVIVASHVERAMFTLDGQVGFRLRQHDEILISRFTEKAKFIKLEGRSFFNVLSEKLKAGGR